MSYEKHLKNTTFELIQFIGSHLREYSDYSEENRLYLMKLLHVASAINEHFPHENKRITGLIPVMRKRLESRNLKRYGFDSAKNKGWRVRFQNGGEIFQRYFSDATFGEEKESFKAAIAFRDEVASRLKDNPSDAKHIFEEIRNTLKRKHL